MTKPTSSWISMRAGLRASGAAAQPARAAVRTSSTSVPGAERAAGVTQWLRARMSFSPSVRLRRTGAGDRGLRDGARRRDIVVTGHAGHIGRLRIPGGADRRILGADRGCRRHAVGVAVDRAQEAAADLVLRVTAR